MTEVELECAVYGEGTVFPVKIARDAKVSALQEAIFDKQRALQEAIFDKQRYHERFSFPPSALTLYVAKKNGAWLKSDPTFETFLKQGRQDDSGYAMKMIPNWILDEDYLGANFKPGRKEIHILAASSYTRVVLLALAAALALALGTVGLSGHPRPDDGHTELLAVSPGPVVAAWATLWLSVALVLTVHCGRSALADLPRNPETTPALAVLRCSCCTSLCKRLVLVAPLLGLACVALALWFDGPLVPPPSTERGRRRRHAVLLVGLVTFGVGAIAWGATGVHWLRRQDDAVLRCAMAVRVVTAELMCAGSLMLLMTCCCRVERHLLPVHTPSVDAGMLSPHALRDPAHTQSTPERLALQERHGPSPHIAV
ncbi:hypothetical protein ATCC90586_001885 [Pythium insidiosum]|nr:hypothetical protein ATCC90586_001885 [Pythium insidiosum]